MTRNTIAALVILAFGGYGLLGIYVPNQARVSAAEQKEAQLIAEMREGWLRGAARAEALGAPDVADTYRLIAADFARTR